MSTIIPIPGLGSFDVGKCAPIRHDRSQTEEHA